MYLYLTILIFISAIFSIEPDVVKNYSDCLTEELYGDFTVEEYNNLVIRRKLVRERMKNQLSRNETGTLLIPVVFHNYYKIIDGVPFRSFCDYATGHSENTWEYNDNNDPQICYQRAEEAMEILNEQFASAFIQFVPPIDTSLVIDVKTIIS